MCNLSPFDFDLRNNYPLDISCGLEWAKLDLKRDRFPFETLRGKAASKVLNPQLIHGKDVSANCHSTRDGKGCDTFLSPCSEKNRV